MKRLIFLILIIICAIILYTCVSPVAAQITTANTFYSSKPIMGSGGNATYLGVSVGNTSITIGFTTNGGNVLGDTVTSSSGTNTISGTYPDISFQDGIMSGTIKFMSSNQTKITFQQKIYPYLKMWDVICETKN